QRLLLGHAFRQLDQRRVRQRHADELGLSAVQATACLDPAEELALLAAAREPARAEEAAPAARAERADHARARFPPVHLGSGLDHRAQELVPEDRAAVETALDAAVDVQ